MVYGYHAVAWWYAWSGGGALAVARNRDDCAPVSVLGAQWSPLRVMSACDPPALRKTTVRNGSEASSHLDGNVGCGREKAGRI